MDDHCTIQTEHRQKDRRHDVLGQVGDAMILAAKRWRVPLVGFLVGTKARRAWKGPQALSRRVWEALVASHFFKSFTNDPPPKITALALPGSCSFLSVAHWSSGEHTLPAPPGLALLP